MVEDFVLKFPETNAEEDVTLRMPEVESQNVSTPRQRERDAAFYSVATGMNMGETLSYVEADWNESLEYQASQQARDSLTNATNEALQYTDDEIDEALATTIEDLRQVESVRRFLPQSMVSALRADVTGSRGMAIDRIAKLHYAGERFQETLEGFGVNANTVLDFGEIAVDPFSLFHQRRYRRLTTEFEQLLSVGVDPDEFEAGVERIITEALDTGVLSNENLFYFAAFLDTLGSGVYSDEEEAARFLGWLDLGLTFGPAATAALRGGARLTSTTALTGVLDEAVGVVPRTAANQPLDAARSTTAGLVSL